MRKKKFWRFFIYITVAIFFASRLFTLWPFDNLFAKETIIKVGTHSPVIARVISSDSKDDLNVLFVSECSVLDKFGYKYLLSKDLIFNSTTSSSCINVQISSVVIDCQGHSIKFEGPGILKKENSSVFASQDLPITRTGVYLNQPNLTLRNCILYTNLTNGAGVFIGPNGDNALIENVVVKNSYSGILIDRVRESEIRDNILKSNINGLILFKSFSGNIFNNSFMNNVYGVFVKNNSFDNVIYRNYFINGYFGVFLDNSQANTIEGNRFEDSFEILGNDKNIFRNNTIYNNTFSGSLHFDGVSQYAYRSVLFGLGNNASLAFWVMRDLGAPPITPNQTVLQLFGSPGILVYFGSDGNYHVLLSLKNKTVDFLLGQPVSGLWAHIVIARNLSGFYTFYFNGNLKEMDEEQLGGELLTKDKSIFLAATPEQGSTGTNAFFSGFIDGLLIYNKSLTSSELIQIFKAGRFFNGSLPKQGLIGEYLFDEQNGSVASDLSGYENSLVIQNGANWTSFLQSTSFSIPAGILPPDDLLEEAKEIEANFSQIEAGFVAELALNNKLKFFIDETFYFLILKDTNNDNASFLVGVSTEPVVLRNGESKSLDVTNDGKEDLLIKLDKITSSNVKVFLQYLSDNVSSSENSTSKTSEVVFSSIREGEKNSSQSHSVLIWILIGAGAVVLVIILVVLFLQKRREKREINPSPLGPSPLFLPPSFSQSDSTGDTSLR